MRAAEKWIVIHCVQGIISPTLANMTLDGLEPLLTQHFPKETWRDGKRWRPKVNLVRYADDFIITGDSRELLENEVRPLVEQFLRERGLTLSPDKTRLTHIDEGFDFLGQNLRKYGGKALAKPSKKNTHGFLEKVRGIIDVSKSVSQKVLVKRLNRSFVAGPTIIGISRPKIPSAGLTMRYGDGCG